MNRQEIIEAVKENYKSINDIKNLNSGGCLYAAYGVFKKLHKDKVPMRNIAIVQAPNGFFSDSLTRNRLYLEGLNSKATSGTHFIIRVYQYFIGSTGDITKSAKGWKKSLEIKGIRKVNRFCESSLDNGNWNEMFNRTKAIPKINEVLGVNLKKRYS